MAKIDIRCPVCSEWKKLDIPDDAVDESTKGLLTINVTAGMICEHSFIVYVDKNLIVRDCFVADFKIEVPGEPAPEQAENEIAPPKFSFKLDLIKLNISRVLMAHILKALFFKREILIISDQDFLYTHIQNFLKYINENSFEMEMTIISNKEYKRSKKQYKDHIIFKNREIIQDKDGLITPKRLEMEKTIIDKFFAEDDVEASLIILKNEINKIFGFAKTIKSFLDNSKESGLTSKMIINHLSEVYNEKITVSYVQFLIGIVKYYFGAKIPEIDGSIGLLGSL
jgi:hypothetical protein